MPSQHYYGSDSTEDVFKFPDDPRPVIRVVRDMEEVRDGVYIGWISHRGRIYNVQFIVGIHKHFKVVSERKDHEQDNKD